jgi:hypothetical protein
MAATSTVGLTECPTSSTRFLYAIGYNIQSHILSRSGPVTPALRPPPKVWGPMLPLRLRHSNRDVLALMSLHVWRLGFWKQDYIRSRHAGDVEGARGERSIYE